MRKLYDTQTCASVRAVRLLTGCFHTAGRGELAKTATLWPTEPNLFAVWPSSLPIPGPGGGLGVQGFRALDAAENGGLSVAQGQGARAWVPRTVIVKAMLTIGNSVTREKACESFWERHGNRGASQAGREWLEECKKAWVRLEMPR